MKQEHLLSRRWSEEAQASSSYGSRASGVARDWRERFLHFVLPARCLSCRAVPERWRSPFGLCQACLGRLAAAPAHSCWSCGAAGAAAEPATDVDDVVCPACQNTRRSYRRLIWGWRYASPIDAVIHALKFRRLDYLGFQLGQELGQRHAATLASVDVVTPVPLAFLRRLGRGFNQAETIADAVAKVGGLPLRTLLARRRGTRPQSLILERTARQLNPLGAFKATGEMGKAWRGCHILLVDDVVTTGATLDAAARSLLEAGAGEVTALVVARTPAPGEGRRQDTKSEDRLQSATGCVA